MRKGAEAFSTSTENWSSTCRKGCVAWTPAAAKSCGASRTPRGARYVDSKRQMGTFSCTSGVEARTVRQYISSNAWISQQAESCGQTTALPGARRASRFLFNQYDVLVANADGATHGISAKDGSHLWSHQTRYGALAAAGLIWALNEQDAGSPGWEGLDPRTGKIVKRVSKWTERRPYHWSRCCGNTATPNFIICGGFDFADFKTGEIKLFNAAKNGCTTAGVVPANGMAYTFPNACWCRNWLRGFCRLCRNPKCLTSPPRQTTAGRLQKGPAYGVPTTTSTQSTQEWPTYRHDTGRSAATTAAGPQRLDVLWQKQVTSPAPASLARQWDVKDDGGRTTAPVVAHGLVFVAASDRHSLTAFDAKTGAPRWNFIAGGRIDCPPTIYEGLCLFGSRDGWIYCVTAKDGSLVWRYRAAPQESKIVAYGQLESVWPVVGGVLVYDGLAYFTAGRHSDIDGGVVVGAVEPETGKPVWMQHAEGLGGTPDVLIGGDGAIEMGSLAFDAKDGHKIDTRARFRAGRLGLRNDAWNKNPIALRKNSNVWTVDKEKSRPDALIQQVRLRSDSGQGSTTLMIISPVAFLDMPVSLRFPKRTRAHRQISS